MAGLAFKSHCHHDFLLRTDVFFHRKKHREINRNPVARFNCALKKQAVPSRVNWLVIQ